MQTASKKVINGWAMYDWANSAYNLVITSTIFPVYYDAITTSTAADGSLQHKVTFLGTEFESAALYNYTFAFAYLIIALISPILSSIADVKGNKKAFMQFFCYLGSLACSGLYFFQKETLSLGIICCVLAAIGYCGSLVFYNSYLPEIASDEDKDKVSARGFAYGYIGSVILQLVCFVLVLFKPFGLTETTASQWSFLLVGIWWISFAQITFRRLPKRKEILASKASTIIVEDTAAPLPTPHLNKQLHTGLLTKGFKELRKVAKEAANLPVLKRFLLAFFFYSMGVQTVMLAATLFGSQVLQMETSNLIACILIIQLVAIFGAYLMAKLSERFGNFQILLLVVGIWIAICITAYFITTEQQFYFVAAVVGLVMGGIQSLSRSTYARIMPITKDTASFFSFYDVTEKIAIVLGMVSFAIVQEYTGDMRNSIIALVVFFIIGALMLLFTLNKQKQISLS